MSQIGTTNLVPLDFETTKANLKTYLKNQAAFKDIDFEASNINVLIDLLSYNTHHNAFYLNMVASEMFLDTAQLRDSAVSHAKMLNYLPQSYRSAKSTVNITIGPSTPSSIESILIPKGSTFTTRVGSNNFTFSTDQNIVVMNSNNTFVASNIDLYEGRYVTESFVYNEGSRFVLSNPNIDTSSIAVVVVDNAAVPYTRSDSFLGVTADSAVYFVQAAENGQYEVMFGDGVFGRQPVGGSTVIIEYRISSGQLPNGAVLFESDGPLGGTANVVVTAVDAAVGGDVPETVDEIRFRAPLAFSTQQRAVTPSDYTTLIRAAFPDISRVGVFGGEDLDPPRFGRVVISMVSNVFDAITETRQNDVLEYISTKTPVTVTPLIVNPDFTYVSVTTEVGYNINHTAKSAEDIRLAALSAIKTYAANNINDFNSTLYYSKMVTSIDSSDESIISNSTDVTVYKTINPNPDADFTGTVDFGNALYDGPAIAGQSHPIGDLYTLRSTFFTFEGKRCLLEDDGLGNIHIYTTVGSDHAIVKPNVATIDYQAGLVSFTNIRITGYEGSSIRLYAKVLSKDIAATKNTILIIKDNDIHITAVPKRV